MTTIEYILVCIDVSSLLRLLRPEEPAQEIIITPPSVSELLEEIKKQQQPKAMELLAKGNVKRKVEAQIITLSS